MLRLLGCNLALVEKTRQVPPGVAPGFLRYLLWLSRIHDLTAAIAALWADIEDVIGLVDCFFVMLDDDDRLHR